MRNKSTKLMRVENDEYLKASPENVDGSPLNVKEISHREYLVPKIKKTWFGLRQKKILVPDTTKQIYPLTLKDKWNLSAHTEQSYVIEMDFGNATSRTFVIRTAKQTFQFMKNLYYLYLEESVFDLSLKQYKLRYDFNYAVPKNRETVQIGDEAYYSVKPDNLKPLIKMEYISNLVKSSMAQKILIAILVIGILAFIVGLIAMIKILKIKTG